MVNKIVLGTAAFAALAAALPQSNQELSYGRTFTRPSASASAAGSAATSASGAAGSASGSAGSASGSAGSASGSAGSASGSAGSASGSASGVASSSASGSSAIGASGTTLVITGPSTTVTVAIPSGRPTGSCTLVSYGGTFSRSCASATTDAAGTGATGTGAASTGAAGTDAAGTGATGTGAAGTGATGTGAAGTGATGTGAVGTGATETDASETDAAGTGAAGTGATGTGAAGTGATGTGAAGSGATGTGAVGTGATGTGAQATTTIATGPGGTVVLVTGVTTATLTNVGGTAVATVTGISIVPPPIVGTEYTSFPVSGYTDAATTLLTHESGFLMSTASTFGPNSQIPAIQTAPGPAPPVRSSQVTGPTSHGPYFGIATTTGAVQGSITLAASIGTLPPNPTATYYNENGMLEEPQPAPYTPYGGLGTNGTLPRYMVESDFDYESITLGLYQEWFELDLFHNGLAIFSEEEFIIAGLTAEDRHLIEFMANQETGHATVLTNMLGQTAPPQCTYNYPFRTVREFVDFNQIITTWGEAGVLGFINHLDSREVAQILSQSIVTESRQEMAFRQMSGLFPMPFWFATGIPQSWQWTYLAPYISTCPQNTTRLAWQNFPALTVVNQANINRWSPNDTADYERTGNRTSDPAISTPDLPEPVSCEHLNVTGFGCGPAISRNRSEPLSFPGKQVRLTWDNPGLLVGPNNSYVTSTQAGVPQFVAWVSQLNLTYTPLVSTGPNSGYTYQPASLVFQGDPAVNGTMFIAITDADLFLTPFNLSMINPHVRALGIYQAG